MQVMYLFKIDLVRILTLNAIFKNTTDKCVHRTRIYPLRLS